MTYRLKNGGGVVESVIIPSNTPDGRTTVCVSSQLGCAMNCQFCFTAKMGLRRNLSAAQIVEQVVNARRLTGGGLRPPATTAATTTTTTTTNDEAGAGAGADVGGASSSNSDGGGGGGGGGGDSGSGVNSTREEVTNVVFMGMGEPLHNIEAVLAAVGRVASTHHACFKPLTNNVCTVVCMNHRVPRRYPRRYPRRRISQITPPLMKSSERRNE